MTEASLDVSLRQGTGKSVARKLRRAGLVPGIIYGVGEPTPIQFDAPTAVKLVHRLHGSERLIALKLTDADGKQSDRRALLKSVQQNALGTELLHIDFHEVDITKPVQVSVEVRGLGLGETAGERVGGIMNQVNYDIVVECLPTAIPEVIEVNVEAMEMGDSLHVGDLTLPEGVTAITAEDETLFTIVAPRAEVEEEAEEGAEAEGEEAAAEGEGESAGEAAEGGEEASEEG